MLEVDVDIRWFVAFSADEAFEEQIGGLWIDGRDAETITDGGIGGRPSPLAEDVLRSGETNDRVDREEIGCILHLADEL
ncbi:hypothetical protein D3C71_1317250 [compost metagenome]